MKCVTWHSREGLMIEESDRDYAVEVPDELLKELKEAKDRVEDIENQIYEFSSSSKKPR